MSTVEGICCHCEQEYEYDDEAAPKFCFKYCCYDCAKIGGWRFSK